MDSLLYKRQRIIIGVLLILGISLIFYSSNPPWDTYRYVVAYHTILALLSTIAAAASFMRTRMDSSPYHKLLYATMVYTSILHIGSAVLHFLLMSSVVAHTQTYGIFFDTFEVFVISLLLLSSAYFIKREIDENSIWYRRFTIPAILVFLFLTTGFVYIFSELGLDSMFYLIGGYVLGSIALVFFFLIIVLQLKHSDITSSHDTVRLAVASFFFVLSTIVLLLVLPNPSMIWLLTVLLQAGAYIYIILATAYPFLRDVKIDSRIAYGLVLAIFSLALFPFLIGQFMKSFLPLAEYRGLGATVFIHIAASFFLISMGLILYFRNNKKLIGYQSPIIFMLLAWAIVEIGLVVSHFNPINVNNIESISPLIIGAMITTICLSIAIKRILNPSVSLPRNIGLRYATGFAFVSIVLYFGEYLQWIIYQLTPSILTTDYGEIILLLICYAALFEFASFILLLAAKSGGRFTWEFIAVGSQSIWIVSLILKSDFQDWTAGWWSADGLIGISVLVFPVIIVLMLRVDPFNVRSIQDRASVISTLLSTEISEFNRTTIDELSKLGQSIDIKERDLDSISRILTNISYADDLIKYLSIIIRGDRFDQEHLENIDLVENIEIAFARVRNKSPSQHMKLQIEEQSERILVSGNNLLSDLFFYLFSVIAERNPDSNLCQIEFKEESGRSEDYWVIRISFKLQPNQHSDNIDLLGRYLIDDRAAGPRFTFVKGLLYAYRGHLQILNRDIDSHNLVLELFLPKAPLT